MRKDSEVVEPVRDIDQVKCLPDIIWCNIERRRIDNIYCANEAII